MIHGIGTDIVSIARVEGVLDQFGERFTRRILAPAEFDAYRAAGSRAAFLARRFAAKEAAAKALGTGIGAPFTFNAIEVRRQPGRRPELHFGEEAARAVRGLGIGEALLSLSDERDYAVAFVVLLRA